MLLGALIVGGLTAYWLGLRTGAWAAGVTFVLLLVSALVPVLATPIHVLLAVAVGVVCIVGPHRERPPDAVRAVRFARATLGHAVSWLRSTVSDTTSRRNRGDDEKR